MFYLWLVIDSMFLYVSLHRSLWDHQLQSGQEDDRKAARTRALELHWRFKFITVSKTLII